MNQKSQKPILLQQDPKFLERLEKLRLLDDDLMRVALADNVPAVQKILRIVLENDTLEVVQLETQNRIHNLAAHEAILDVLAKNSDGELFDIEIQRKDRGAVPQRARYYSSLLDASLLAKGEKYTNLVPSYIIFIMESDLWQDGLPVYHIERRFRHTKAYFGDGTHILYVNGAYRGDNPIGVLMSDFRATDPDAIQTPELKGAVYNLKKTEGGVAKMCKIMEEIKAEGRAELLFSLVRQMKEQGKSLEEVINALTPAASEEEIEQYYNQA